MDPPFTREEAEVEVARVVGALEELDQVLIFSSDIKGLLQSRCQDLLVHGKEVPFDFCGHDWQAVCRWAMFWPERKVTFQFIAGEWECIAADRMYWTNGREVAFDRAYFPDEDLQFPERWPWKVSDPWNSNENSSS